MCVEICEEKYGDCLFEFAFFFFCVFISLFYYSFGFKCYGLLLEREGAQFASQKNRKNK